MVVPFVEVAVAIREVGWTIVGAGMQVCAGCWIYKLPS